MGYRFLLFSVLLLGMPVYDAVAQPMPEMIPYNKEGRWGYSDSLGKLVIAPQWDSAGFFVDGRALVKVKNSKQTAFCIINERGDYIVPPSRNWNGKWAGKSGAELNAHDSNGRWGMIDTNNHELVHFEYDAPIKFRFCSGFVYHPEVEKWYLFANKDGEQGVIDDHNKVLVPIRYTYVFNPFTGAPYYFYVNNGSMKTGVVDTNGNEVVKSAFYDLEYMALPMGNGNTLKGFRVRAVSMGPGPIYQIGWQDVPPTGLQLDTAYLEYYTEGNFIVFKRNGSSYFEVINKAGRKITKMKLESVYLSAKGNFVFKKSGGAGYGIMDTTGKVLLAPGYDQLYCAGNRYYVYRLPGNGLYGVMDGHFNTLLKPTYETITFENDSVKVTRTRYTPHPDICYKYFNCLSASVELNLRYARKLSERFPGVSCTVQN